MRIGKRQSPYTVITAVTIVIGASFWWGYTENQSLRAEFQESWASHSLSHTPPINGRPVAFGATRQVDGSHRTTNASLTLVVATADTCPASIRALPELQALLEDSGLRPGDHVALVTYDGMRIPGRLRTALEDRQVEFSILRVTNPNQFQKESGVGATPTVAVLDGARRMRLVTSLIDSSSRHIIAAQLAEMHTADRLR